MNSFDASILSWFNSFAQASQHFDLLLWEISENHLLKGGVPITLLWFFWFNKEKGGKKIPSPLVREQVIITLLSCFAAILIGRLLALNLPFRPRPITNITLHFVIPYGVGHRAFSNMSSFPSDHATFMFSLAMGIWLISRRIGVATLLYVTTIVLLPRIYLGLHYPTDIVAGCFIGIFVTLLLHNSQLFRTLVVKPLITWSGKSPDLFYMLFFISTFEVASMFDDIRILYHITVQLINNTLI
jgi:undecaprenyl-diphosphatase